MRGDGTLRDFWHPKSGERRAESGERAGWGCRARAREQ